MATKKKIQPKAAAAKSDKKSDAKDAVASKAERKSNRAAMQSDAGIKHTVARLG